MRLSEVIFYIVTVAMVAAFDSYAEGATHHRVLSDLGQDEVAGIQRAALLA